MWLNVKPYTADPFNTEEVEYTVSINDKLNNMDQKRALILVKPGHQTSVKGSFFSQINVLLYFTSPNSQPTLLNISYAISNIDLGSDLYYCQTF